MLIDLTTPKGRASNPNRDSHYVGLDIKNEDLAEMRALLPNAGEKYADLFRAMLAEWLQFRKNAE